MSSMMSSTCPILAPRPGLRAAITLALAIALLLASQRGGPGPACASPGLTLAFPVPRA